MSIDARFRAHEADEPLAFVVCADCGEIRTRAGIPRDWRFVYEGWRCSECRTNRAHYMLDVDRPYPAIPTAAVTAICTGILLVVVALALWARFG